MFHLLSFFLFFLCEECFGRERAAKRKREREPKEVGRDLEEKKKETRRGRRKKNNTERKLPWLRKMEGERESRVSHCVYCD